MHPLFNALNDNLVLVASIITSLGTIFGVPFLRRPAMRILAHVAMLFRAPYILVAEQKSARQREEERDRKIEEMQKQLKPNGGSSMVDSLARLENGQGEALRAIERLNGHRKQEFIMQPRPAMELDGRGSALLVSAAMGRLVKAEAGGLRGITWQGYLEGARVLAFQEAFQRVAQASSEFRGFEVGLFAESDGVREPRGRWEIRAVPIARQAGRGKDDDVLYAATLHPVDEVARQIAERNRWVN